jgi:hypothetical protein
MATAYEVDVRVNGDGVDDALTDIERHLRASVPAKRLLDGDRTTSIRTGAGGGITAALLIDANDASIAERHAFDLVRQAVTAAGVDGSRAWFDVVVRSSS